MYLNDKELPQTRSIVGRSMYGTTMGMYIGTLAKGSHVFKVKYRAAHNHEFPQEDWQTRALTIVVLPAPVPCKLDSKYTDVGDCSPSCGDKGTQLQERKIIREPRFDGKACPKFWMRTRKIRCGGYPCAVDCVWGAWSGLGACSKSCGGGSYTQMRKEVQQARHGGRPCEGEFDRVNYCNQDDCPVDCQYSFWAPWSECSAECGGGTRTRIREVSSFAEFGGRPCTGSQSEDKECNKQECEWDSESAAALETEAFVFGMRRRRTNSPRSSDGPPFVPLGPGGPGIGPELEAGANSGTIGLCGGGMVLVWVIAGSGVATSLIEAR